MAPWNGQSVLAHYMCCGNGGTLIIFLYELAIDDTNIGRTCSPPQARESAGTAVAARHCPGLV